ncbi:MAG: nicotinate-nicotinamide nucleotide adenylyltransferase [Deltaproteobacteria bacterium]|nr:nicotinate-nicotinamide nucleotide adenylyltransferase [Deltaproteobacteria bacterium]
MSKAKRIGVFGSSFDPPHLGHVAVIEDLLHKKLFDEIWLMPVFKHAFGKKLAPFEERLAFLKALQEHIPDPALKVTSIEKELNLNPSYTVDVLKALVQKHPDAAFHLILGSDCRKDLPKWKDSNTLQQLCDFYFIPRPGHESSPYPDISSTQIRKAAQAGQDLSTMTLPEIARLIADHKLYRE